MSDIRTYPLHPDAVWALTAISERHIYPDPSSARAIDLDRDRIGWDYAKQLAEAGPCIEPPVVGVSLQLTDIGRTRLEVSKAVPYVHHSYGRRRMTR